MNSIELGFCQCGCGNKTWIATKNDVKRGWTKGVPVRFFGRHCIRPDPLDRFWEKVNKLGPDDCWEWQAARTHDGYGEFGLDGAIVKAHRFAYKMFVGQIPDGQIICHHCDNPPCCNPNHLFLGTDLINNHDMMSKGRNVVLRGVNNGFAKLNDNLVREIKQCLLDGMKQRDIAIQFRISKGTVSGIAKNRTWKHVI